MKKIDKTLDRIAEIRAERILARLEAGLPIHPDDQDAAHKMYMARNKRLHLKATHSITQEDQQAVNEMTADQLVIEVQENAPPHARLPGSPDDAG